MKKIIFAISLFIGVNLSADLILNANEAYRNGNYAEAMKLYTKACDIENATGCNSVATMYIKGNGVEQDDKKIIEFLTKACDFNHANGCYDLGYFYFRGMYVKEDKSKARGLFDKSCNAGNVRGCKNYRRLTNAGVK